MVDVIAATQAVERCGKLKLPVSIKDRPAFGLCAKVVPIHLASLHQLSPSAATIYLLGACMAR